MPIVGLATLKSCQSRGAQEEVGHSCLTRRGGPLLSLNTLGRVQCTAAHEERKATPQAVGVARVGPLGLHGELWAHRPSQTLAAFAQLHPPNLACSP
jgi:hypothetical protein